MNPPESHLPLSGFARWQQWALLLALTLLAALPLSLLQLPATYMLAAILAGIAVQLGGGDIRLPKPPQSIAEALLGAMIAGAVTPMALSTFRDHAPLFLAIVLSIIAASSLLGWGLHQLRLLPGTTAIWGLSPGAAQAMMLMAGPFGGDVRLVAFMQYLRVLMVAAIAPVVAHLWTEPAAAPQAAVAGVAVGAQGVVTALALAAVGLALARRFPVPAGTILIPMTIGGVLHVLGVVEIALPDALLVAVYVVLGWGIGLAFTLPVLRHAARVLPHVAAATLVLIGLCGGLAMLLARFDGIDALTAYLATSPGGLSSVAIIAATSRVDFAFVISLQTVRFVLVLILGPVISRFIAKRAQRAS